MLDLSISPYKSNLHIYIISITIIDEGDVVVPSLTHYDVSTEQATEEMLYDFENKSSKIYLINKIYTFTLFQLLLQMKMMQKFLH